VPAPEDTPFAAEVFCFLAEFQPAVCDLHAKKRLAFGFGAFGGGMSQAKPE
jgi:hypothetical protein